MTVRQKVILEVAAGLAVLAGLFFLLKYRTKEIELEPTPSPTPAIGDTISEGTQNPGEKVPETNPFKTETNPFKYENPFR